MKIYFNEPSYENEITALFKAFYPFECFEKGELGQSDFVCTVSDTVVLVAHFVDGERVAERSLTRSQIHELSLLAGKAYTIQCKTLLRGLVYDLIAELTGKKLPWGILTGIRPTKLAFKLYKETGSYDETAVKLMQGYRISSDKASLLIKVIINEAPYMAAEEGEHSIYIGIPFCPTKCSYCTFPSYQADRWQNEFSNYTDALLKELEAGSKYFKDCTSVYIGGGTPTALTESDFGRLLDAVRAYLGNREVEFTVEAGRPDSISENKLASMKTNGVNRLSINPQTMQDDTLERIGRKHDAKAIPDCFSKAREMGFAHINMDLILGLPGEDSGDVEDTLNKVMALSPESITVHTLAFKRGSMLTEDRTELLLAADKDIHESLAIVQRMMAESGYRPYYLYRQKQMVGQYENVGYCKPGHESIYNIRIMEEVEDIVAFGAGAISKRVRGRKISRLDQPKDIRTYLSKLDEITDRKREFFI